MWETKSDIKDSVYVVNTFDRESRGSSVMCVNYAAD